MNRNQRAFLAAIRGEILDPVNAIIQVSEILLAETADLEQEDFLADLRKIHASGRRLREMVDEFLAPETFADQEGDTAFKSLQSRVRHDLFNALNPVINYCEMWLEDAAEQFLEGFQTDLQRIHGHGKRCMALLDKVLGYRQQDLPAAEEPAELAPRVEADPLFAWEQSVDKAAAIEPGYCLVVDDNPTNRDILCRLLLRQGHRVATAVNGREALEMVQAEPFDLVLLDIMMPELNGFQVLDRLKDDDRLRDVPVIMISALDQDDAVLRCIAMGAEDYLPKPFNPLLLKARIGACLEKKRFRDKEQIYLQQIKQEKARSDELLHVILPDEIVAELKATNGVKPRRYDNVAVLFADIVGFTPYCDRHGPEEVVLYLQSLVESWETSALKYGVEKIKTIGDAFMAASGLLKPVENPVLSCVRCGLEMIAAAEAMSIGWTLRVGIHVGQVVAGVIGRRQYLFDLWGDTVNTAARMESHGIKGSITLSHEAWGWIAKSARGESYVVEVKGKGPLEMVRFCEFTQERPPDH
jgi:CheY-like chemotaxis protein